MNDGTLAKEVYMDESVFSTERCRLTQDQRAEAFEMYVRYQSMVKQYDWWDDCDRVVSALAQSGLLEKTPSNERRGARWPEKITFDKVYVDEVSGSANKKVKQIYQKI